MEKLEKGVGLIERILASIEKYKITTILKAVVILLIIAGAIGFISNPTYLMDIYETHQSKIHKTMMDERIKNSSKIQSSIDRLLYTTNASRVIIIEYHNSTSSLYGVPYLKGTAIFEALNNGIIPVSNQYKDVILTLVPFVSHLSQIGYWCGDTEEMKQLDKSLYYRLLSNNTNHFASVKLENEDGVIGIMFISFEGLDDIHSCEDVKNKVIRTAHEVGVLLKNKR